MTFEHQNAKVTTLYSTEQISEVIARMGEQITADYAGKEPLLVCILRGAAVFMADLARAIDLPLETDYMAVSSYGDATVSSGRIKIEKDLSTDVKDRDFIVVEDIVDTGLTLNWLLEQLKHRGAASVAVAAFMHKHRPDTPECRYEGFDCPDAYVIGYGLDAAQKYRNLPYVGILHLDEEQGQ